MIVFFFGLIVCGLRFLSESVGLSRPVCAFCHHEVEHTTIFCPDCGQNTANRAASNLP